MVSNYTTGRFRLFRYTQALYARALMADYSSLSWPCTLMKSVSFVSLLYHTSQLLHIIEVYLAFSKTYIDISRFIPRLSHLFRNILSPSDFILIRRQNFILDLFRLFKSAIPRLRETLFCLLPRTFCSEVFSWHLTTLKSRPREASHRTQRTRPRMRKNSSRNPNQSHFRSSTESSCLEERSGRGEEG
jgi:hypothetical protein